MPLFSEHLTNMYYSGTPSYSSSPYSYSSSPYGTSYSASYLNPGGSYSNHSSLTPYTRTLSSRWLLGGGRNYSPILSTISEKGTTSPVRINSPRRTPISSRSYISSNYTPRPININTADIDVSRDKYRNKITGISSINTEPRRPSPLSNNKKESKSDITKQPTTGVDSSPGSPPQRSTIKRDRPVVRLHTIKRKDRDSPRKPIESSQVETVADVTTEKDKIEPLKWRERLADDLAFKNKREKKTIGEKLVEKFTLRDKDDTDVECNLIEMSKDQNLDEPDPVLLAVDVTPIDNTKSFGRRCSMELLAEQASLLDSLIRRENLSTATLDLSKIGTETIENLTETPDNEKRKSAENANPLATTKSDHSLLSKRGTKRKSLRKSTSGENIYKLDRISEMPLLITENISVIDENNALNKNYAKSTDKKPKLKQKITSSVEVSSPSNPLKFVVENVTVEENPLPKKKDIVYSAIIEDVNVSIKPKTVTSNAVDTGHRKSVKIKLKSEQKNVITEDVASPEPEDGNFWGKIGKRETVYLSNRKKDLNTAKEEKERSFSWLPEYDEKDLDRHEPSNNDETDPSKRDSQLNIVKNHDIQQLQETLQIINDNHKYKNNQDDILLEKEQTKIGFDVNADEKKIISNSDVMPGREEMLKSEEKIKTGDQSNLHLLIGPTDKKDDTKTMKMDKQENKRDKSPDLSTTSAKNIDTTGSITSDILIEKEAISKNKNDKKKIVKKVIGSKEKVNKKSQEINVSDKINKGVSECNEVNKKDAEIKPMPKNIEYNKVLPKSISEPNILKTNKSNSLIKKDKQEDLIQQNNVVPENEKDNIIAPTSLSETNILNINTSDSTIPKNNKNDLINQNNKESVTETEKGNQVLPNYTLEPVIQNSNKNESLSKDEKSDSKIQNDVNVRLENNIISNISAKCISEPEVHNNLITSSKSSPSIVPNIENCDNEKEPDLQEKEKVNVDLVQIKEVNSEEKMGLQHDEKHSYNNKHEVIELNKEIIVKNEDIPGTNIGLRLSQKLKTNDIKTDLENQKENRRESVKRPIQNTDTNLLFANKKPVKDVPAPKPLIATPRPLQKKVPQVIRSSSSETSSTEDSSDEDEDNSSESSADSYGCENNVDGRTSTGSNDSGFDSSAPTSPSGFSYARKGADHPSTSTSAAQNHNHDIVQQELEQSTAYGIFRKTGRFTPPARSIPRFRKYTIDDFQFIKVLGKGSFGKVMLAELRETEYYYAVKCLKKDVVLEDDDVECTLIERKVLALGTNHPYLCHLFATFQTDSHLFFVMEYLNGGDLMFHIQQSGRFPEPRATLYAAEIVSGLKFLHKRGIVYRDLKLDNILLDFDGHVRIADFGMCKLQIYLDKTADTFCGTPDYMAPEIIKGLKYNQTVDWWSFGVLLYEMLIGQSPFSGCDEDELFWSICNEMPSYPRFLSTESLSILTRLLDKDARTRLGGIECMHGDIRDQDFFKPIQWEKLERRELEAPFKPRVRHPLDTQYFDRAFTGERPRLTAVEPQVLRSMDQEPFRGFSYTNPNATDR